MSYIINNSRGNIVAVIPDGSVNTSTSLTLIGQGVTNYGTDQNENLVYLLENFASPTAPSTPILGQLWYNSSSDSLYSYSSANVWVVLANDTYVQAQKVSPAFTGVPTAPTATSGTANTQIATTAFVTNSPALSGVPTAPTAANGTNTTQIATTAFVRNATLGLGTMSQQNASAVTITGGTIAGITPIAITAGGTGASDAANARINLGLGSGATTSVGTIATQNANAVAITGGTISGLSSPIDVASGGTGGNTAAAARAGIDAVGTSLTITAGAGLTGGGDLTNNRTLAISTNSNGYGNRTVSTSAPTGGSSGDIWYQV